MPAPVNAVGSMLADLCALCALCVPRTFYRSCALAPQERRTCREWRVRLHCRHHNPLAEEDTTHQNPLQITGVRGCVTPLGHMRSGTGNNMMSSLCCHCLAVAASR